MKMRFKAGIVLPAALLLVIGLSTANATASTCVSIYVNAPTPVRHAADQLSDYTGIPVDRPAGDERSIRIELNSTQNPKIGAQGYTVRSVNDREIQIRGNDAEGAADGVYTLLRTLMIEHRKDPFSRNWEVEEKPAFAIRAMLVSPYRFGASYGFAVLSPDRWSFEEWRRYIDFMRLCNMTTLVMGSERVYDPAYPHSRRNKWRYQVWKQVMDYCHQVGMKFNWFMTPNLVPPQAFWDNPGKRAAQEEGSWYGNGLSWTKAKDLILKDESYTLQYFRGLDGLELIYSDGGAFDFNNPDPAGYIADSTRSYMKLLRQDNNDAQFVYWNWLLDLWSRAFIPENILQKYPKYKTLQQDVLPLLPKNVTWLDASLLTVIQEFGKDIRMRGNPPMPEGILIGKDHGFKPVIDFFWYMNPEFSLNIFPHPYIRRGIQEARYARDELGVDGVEGYRLAPPCRFIGDYVFFRLASDPSLTQQELVNELAGLLADRAQDEPQVKEAINTLERFWTTRKLSDIEKADRLFRGLLPEDHSKNLEYVSNGVTFLTYIVRMAQPGVTAEQKAQLKRELYQTVKPMYIFQGLTADVVWLPEAIRFFNARVDMMVQDYHYYLDVPDVVDRSIYPKATAQPVRLRWPKEAGAAQN